MEALRAQLGGEGGEDTCPYDRHPRGWEGGADLARIPPEAQGRRLGVPSVHGSAHTYLLKNAASSTRSRCFICVPRSRVMLSALAWPWEMICRGEG